MSYIFGNPEDGFCRVKAQLLYVSFKPTPEDFNILIANTGRLKHTANKDNRHRQDWKNLDGFSPFDKCRGVVG